MMSLRHHQIDSYFRRTQEERTFEVRARRCVHTKPVSRTLVKYPFLVRHGPSSTSAAGLCLMWWKSIAQTMLMQLTPGEPVPRVGPGNLRVYIHGLLARFDPLSATSYTSTTWLRPTQDREEAE